MPAREVVIVGAARTPIGKYGGSFRDIHPAELGAVAATAAIARAGVQPADIHEVVIGHGRQAGSGPNPARQVGHRAGIPHAAPAQTINKACASAPARASWSRWLHELERRQARRGLATLCISGGMGMALAVERM